MQIDGNEERVVVQHLLEVRDEPFTVDRVAVEPAAHEVVHTAERHRVECLLDHLGLAAPQQELEHGRRRELRGSAEAAPHGVELRAQAAHGAAQ